MKNIKINKLDLKKTKITKLVDLNYIKGGDQQTETKTLKPKSIDPKNPFCRP